MNRMIREGVTDLRDMPFGKKKKLEKGKIPALQIIQRDGKQDLCVFRGQQGGQ